MIYHNDETTDTTIQVPHVSARRRADVSASNFHDVLFAGGDWDVPGLVFNRLLSFASKTLFDFAMSLDH